MTEFMFVRVTIAIILGLGVTEILRNIAGQIRRKSHIEVYPLQVFASLILLFFIIVWLWGFSGSSAVTWTFPVFILKVLPAIALALSAQIIVLDFDSSKSPKEQYFKNSRVVYLILASAPLYELIFTAVTLKYLSIAVETLKMLIIFRLAGAGVVASLAFIKKPAYHWVVLLGLCIAVIETTTAVLFKLKF